MRAKLQHDGTCQLSLLQAYLLWIIVHGVMMWRPKGCRMFVHPHKQHDTQHTTLAAVKQEKPCLAWCEGRMHPVEMQQQWPWQLQVPFLSLHTTPHDRQTRRYSFLQLA